MNEVNALEGSRTEARSLEVPSSEPRPVWLTEDERRVALRDLLPGLVRSGYVEEGDEEGALEDLVSITGREKDGYHLARELDVKGWRADASLVEEMGGADWKLRRALAHKIAEWIKATGLCARFDVGARVAFSLRFRGDFIGEVVRIDHESGRSAVFVEELGHVREGSGVRGVGVNWEDLRDAE